MGPDALTSAAQTRSAASVPVVMVPASMSMAVRPRQDREPALTMPLPVIRRAWMPFSTTSVPSFTMSRQASDS